MSDGAEIVLLKEICRNLTQFGNSCQSTSTDLQSISTDFQSASRNLQSASRNRQSMSTTVESMSTDFQSMSTNDQSMSTFLKRLEEDAFEVVCTKDSFTNLLVLSVLSYLFCTIQTLETEYFF